MTATGELLPKQAEFIECEALYSAAYGGVGAGKTLAAQWRMYRRLRTYPLAGHYVTGADFEQLKGGYFLDFRTLLADVLHWQEGRDFRYIDNPRPQIIMADNGARLRSLSSELAERIRSTHIQTLHAEEPQTWHRGEQVWQTLVGRMRHSVRSGRSYPTMPIQAWLTFNPGGSPGAPVGSWLHAMIEKRWPKQGYPSWRFSLRDNYLIENVDQYIQNLENNLPVYAWSAEIDGHWPTTGGDWYRGFDTSVHCAPPPVGFPPMAMDPRRGLLWALDFNINPQASVVAQFWTQPSPRINELWQNRVLYVFDEIFLDDATVDEVCSEFISRYGEVAKSVGVTLYGDATGRNRTQQSRSSNWDVVREHLRAAGIRVTFRVRTINPPVVDRRNATLKQFGTGEGYGLLIDGERCRELVSDFLEVRQKKGKDDIDKTSDLRRSHVSDACTYLIAEERRPAALYVAGGSLAQY